MFSKNSYTELDTHKLIVVQALKVLVSDWSSTESQAAKDNLNIMQQNVSSLIKGCVLPDIKKVYSLYQDHFYDPDTGKNFTDGRIPDTAESQTRRYMGEAIYLWVNKDYSEAVEKLGMAMHYFSDLNEPHHAANWLGGPGTAHTKFEQYVEDHKNDYAVFTLGYKTNTGDYKSLNNQYNFLGDFLFHISNSYAKKAKAFVNKASMQSSNEDWQYVAKAIMKNAQEGAAIIMYRFIQEVTMLTSGQYKPVEIPLPIGKFNVLISTGEETKAGTDDYVYFGMETGSNKKVEYLCDVPGNDFEGNTTMSYEFTITDPAFDASQIKKVWIRKQKHGVSDDMLLKKVSIYMKCRNVFSQSANKWLSGNECYIMNVTGFYY